MDELNAEYWNNRYNSGDFPWDIGYISTPLKEYFDQLDSKELKILVPGAGNSYEAEYLFKNGFKNVFVLDYAEKPLNEFAQRLPGFPKEHLIHENFFEHNGSYDLVVEQTFFCALDPELRKSYVSKMNNLLKPGGKLVGLLFDDKLNTDKPPFGGCKDDYLPLFSEYFRLRTFETAYNSIKPRAGRELFMIALKK